jgi:hypothetical protein
VWSTARSASYLGGSEQISVRAGSKLTYRVTARAVGYVATKAANRGQMAVYVDGRRVATVDLHSRTTSVRQQVWSTTWPSTARHNVTLVNLGTRGRSMVGVDAITRLS